MNYIISRFRTYILRYLELQLFVTIVTLPIIIQWGLPLSVMLFIGNIIFHPFLFLFLFLSSLVFFTELLGIPNGIFIAVLEYVTAFWHWILSCSSSSWLIAIPASSSALLVIIVFASFAIILYRKAIKNEYRVSALAMLLFISIATLRTCFMQYPRILTLECGNGSVIIIKTDQKTILIDCGYLKRVKDDWIEYTLMPALIKNFGAVHLDQLIEMYISTNTFNALHTLLKHVSVNELYMIYWHGQSHESLLRAYGRLKWMVNNKQTAIHRITQPTIFSLDEKTLIIATPLKESIRYRDCTFCVLKAHLKTAYFSQELYTAGYTACIDNAPCDN